MAKNRVESWTQRQRDKITDIRKLVVLSSSDIESESYMRQKMHRIMAISNSIGHPVISLLAINPECFTSRKECWRKNESLWSSFQDEDQSFIEASSGRPSVWSRFRLHVRHRIAKKGLLHSHIIMFMDPPVNFFFWDPLKIDKHISAEILSLSDTGLRETVLWQMIHYPLNSCASAPFFLKEVSVSKGSKNHIDLKQGLLKAIINSITKEEICGMAMKWKGNTKQKSKAQKWNSRQFIGGAMFTRLAAKVWNAYECGVMDFKG